MVRCFAALLIFLVFQPWSGNAQDYPNPWFEAVVGKPQSTVEVHPHARQHTSVSAVRELGEVSVVVNSPQVTSVQVFRPMRSDEAAFDYIKAAVQEAKRNRLHLKIPPNVYLIRIPEQAGIRAHVELLAVQDALLDFQGSTLILQDLTKPGFLLTDSRRVAIVNATIWWSGLSHVMGTIERSSGGLRIKIHRDYAPHVEASALLQQKVEAVLPASTNLPHLWDLDNYVHEYHNVSDQSEFVYSRESGSYIPKRVDILAPFSPGRSVLVQNKKFGSNAFQLVGGSDVTIRGCTIGHTPGMGLFSPYFERGLAWIDNKISPVSHPLHVTTTADGVHLRNMGGDFVIQGSTFERTSDDPVNVYAGLTEVVSVESESVFVIRARHIQSDVKLFRANSEVFFVDDRVWPRGRALVATAEPISKGLIRLTTSRALPAVKVGHSAFVSESVPRRGIVSNNLVSGVRGRAGLVLQATSTSIVGNSIRYSTGPAILSGGFQNWFVEGPLAANVRIRDNSITNVGLAPFFNRFNLRGAISVGSGTMDPPEVSPGDSYRAHWGIAIVRNTIAHSPSPGIQVQDAQTVWIRENNVSHLSGSAPSVEVRNACGVQFKANSLEGAAVIENQKCIQRP